MKELFAGSFVFLAMLNRHDRKHTEAVRLLSSHQEPLVTTAWIITKLADGLCPLRSRHLFVALEHKLKTNPRITIIPPDQQLYETALDLYRHRPDKKWSLTDCVSFLVMRQRGIQEALTGDHHFEQAGFAALLK